MSQLPSPKLLPSRYKLIVVVLVIAVVVLGVGFALAALSNPIFKASSSTPSGFTFVHGTVKVSQGGSPTEISFLNETGTKSSASSITSGAYQITLRSNVLYDVIIYLKSSPYLCNANPGTIVTSGSDKTQDFSC